MLLAIAAALLMPAAFVSASELTSEHYRLGDPVIAAAGAKVASGGASETIAASATVGQPSPLGVLTGPTSGLTLETGFVAAVPEPGPTGMLVSALACLGLLRGRTRRRGRK